MGVRHSGDQQLLGGEFRVYRNQRDGVTLRHLHQNGDK